MVRPSTLALVAIVFLALHAFVSASRKDDKKEDYIEALFKLNKLKDLGVLTDNEFESRKNVLLNDYLGFDTSRPVQHGPGKRYVPYRTKVSKQNNINSKAHLSAVKRGVAQDPNPGNGTAFNWTMPVIFTPQVDWLVSLFRDNMPRSYDDVLPATGLSYWRSHLYLSQGAFDYNGTRLPLDHDIAIQERAMTHVGLNIYDGGVWSVALALCGLSDLVDIYQRNVLYTSSTGANLQVGGLKSIRAWEPNPDPEHPPDLFYYGASKISNLEIADVRMPGNMTFIRFEEGCDCPTSGCCPQEGLHEIPGNYFYRMIGPSYIMTDPLQGKYGHVWRAEPAGPNPDPAQYWNLAGIIHWNDWKPITGENVWGGILGPLQVMFIKNCSHVPKFDSFETAPHEVQLALSLLPASEALLSPLGSMYHCPLGTKMYPPDPSEETNVSNENNFSAWAAFKALAFVLEEFYTGGDPVLDEAKDLTNKLVEGLDSWFANHLLPAQIAGETVISQGGHVTFDGTYEYQEGAQAFAVDCQTWGLLVVGQKRFDAAYAGKTTAYDVWQAAKKLAGYYINGSLAGVGYTVPEDYNETATKHDIWSGEWTWGAIFMTRKLAMEYERAGKHEWAQSLMRDSMSMVKLMSRQAETDRDGVWSGGGLVQVDGSYLYANKRFFIPWGWYANPIGATSSTGWAVMWDFKYNPFMLGGGQNTTFYDEQCEDFPPEEGLLEKILKFYDY